MSDELVPALPEGQFLIYTDGGLNLQVRLDGPTVWLPQKLIAELFQVTVPTVNEHLANIYDESELSPESTIRKFRIVQTEGNRQVARLVDHYNLDAILAVGYRVRSHLVFGLKGRFYQPKAKPWVPVPVTNPTLKGSFIIPLGGHFHVSIAVEGVHSRHLLDEEPRTGVGGRMAGRTVSCAGRHREQPWVSIAHCRRSRGSCAHTISTRSHDHNCRCGGKDQVDLIGMGKPNAGISQSHSIGRAGTRSFR